MLILPVVKKLGDLITKLCNIPGVLRIQGGNKSIRKNSLKKFLMDFMLVNGVLIQGFDYPQMLNIESKKVAINASLRIKFFY